MTDEELISFLNLPAINISWFAREFYGLKKQFKKKNDPRINNFIMKIRARELTDNEIIRIREVIRSFSGIEL